MIVVKITFIKWWLRTVPYQRSLTKYRYFICLRSRIEAESVRNLWIFVSVCPLSLIKSEFHCQSLPDALTLITRFKMAPNEASNENTKESISEDHQLTTDSIVEENNTPSPPNNRYLKDLDQGWAWVVLGTIFVAFFIMQGQVGTSNIYFVVYLQEFHHPRSITAFVGAGYTAAMNLSGMNFDFNVIAQNSFITYTVPIKHHSWQHIITS